MSKKRIIQRVIAVTLLAALVGESGIVSDGPGLPVTASAYAYPTGGGGGGGC
jgi:hypothetical protein